MRNETKKIQEQTFKEIFHDAEICCQLDKDGWQGLGTIYSMQTCVEKGSRLLLSKTTLTIW